MNKLLASAALAGVLALSACGEDTDFQTGAYDDDTAGSGALGGNAPDTNAQDDTNLAQGDPLDDQFDTAQPGQPGAQGDLSGQDSADMQETREFVQQAAYGNMVEIRASQVAVGRADREEVREFARTVINDHQQASEDLEAAVQTVDVTVPQFLEQDQLDQIDDITTASAENFDQDYLDLMEEQHEQAVSLFEDYVENGRNQELQRFAQNTLPTLESHLETVRSIREGFDAGDDALGFGSGDDAAAEDTPSDADAEDQPAAPSGASDASE